jgi:hypothetical protein
MLTSIDPSSFFRSPVPIDSETHNNLSSPDLSEQQPDFFELLPLIDESDFQPQPTQSEGVQEQQPHPCYPTPIHFPTPVYVPPAPLLTAPVVRPNPPMLSTPPIFSRPPTTEDSTKLPYPSYNYNSIFQLPPRMPNDPVFTEEGWMLNGKPSSCPCNVCLATPKILELYGEGKTIQKIAQLTNISPYQVVKKIESITDGMWTKEELARLSIFVPERLVVKNLTSTAKRLAPKFIGRTENAVRWKLREVHRARLDAKYEKYGR